MTLPVWPPYVKGIVRDGYRETPDYGVLRTEMDAGLAKQRARFSKPIKTRECTLIVTSTALKQDFEAWFEQDLAGGAGWFTFPDPVDGVEKSARIVGGAIRWKPIGLQWEAGRSDGRRIGKESGSEGR